MVSNLWKHAFYLTIIVGEKELPHITSCNPLKNEPQIYGWRESGLACP